MYKEWGWKRSKFSDDSSLKLYIYFFNCLKAISEYDSFWNSGKRQLGNVHWTDVHVHIAYSFFFMKVKCTLFVETRRTFLICLTKPKGVGFGMFRIRACHVHNINSIVHVRCQSSHQAWINRSIQYNKCNTVYKQNNIQYNNCMILSTRKYPWKLKWKRKTLLKDLLKQLKTRKTRKTKKARFSFSFLSGKSIDYVQFWSSFSSCATCMHWYFVAQMSQSEVFKPSGGLSKKSCFPV